MYDKLEYVILLIYHNR